jgi:hypothetical protein
MKSFLPLITCAALLGLPACGPGTDPVRPMLGVGTVTVGSYTVTLRSALPLGTGANVLYAEIAQTDGDVVPDLTVLLLPTMDMGGGVLHGCPVSGPMQFYSSNGQYVTDVIFPVAGTWRTRVSFSRPGMTAIDADFSLGIPDAASTSLFTSGGTQYVLSYDYVGSPGVASNLVVIGLYASTDGSVTFTAVDDATIELVPVMTGTGHAGPRRSSLPRGARATTRATSGSTRPAAGT